MKQFNITFSDNWIKRYDILETSEGIQLRVVSTPTRTWYKLLLQWLTFGLYKAPWWYTVEVDDKHYKYNPNRCKL